jgi:3'5'-cyclic nucleotide phosphodiesterase
VAHFAIIFSALIHDMDHRGVSNKQLQVEEPALSRRYNGKSIAEQNSLDMAWNIFSLEHFAPLRAYLFQSADDLARFRQILVNMVLATDLFDAELSALRRNRWDKAFGSSGSSVTSNQSRQSTTLSRSANNGLRATIVIEHIIQVR